MAAPKGNQNAKDNPTSGRPNKYDLGKEAEDLLKWSLRQDALRLYGFTNDKDYCVSDLPTFAKKHIVFSNALKKAKERLALRREQYSNEDLISSHVYNKTSHIYDHEGVSADDKIKDRELKRKIKLIDYEIKKKSEIDAGVPILTDKVNLENEIMKLRSENQKLKNTIDDNKP